MIARVSTYRSITERSNVSKGTAKRGTINTIRQTTTSEEIIGASATRESPIA